MGIWGFLTVLMAFGGQEGNGGDFPEIESSHVLSSVSGTVKISLNTC